MIRLKYTKVKVSEIKEPITFFCRRNLSSKLPTLKTSYLRHQTKPAHFFKVIQANSVSSDLKSMNSLLQNEKQLQKTLYTINQGVIGDYLQKNFVFWLNAYAKQAGSSCADYLGGNISLDMMCKNFTRFCFDNKIHLDPIRTLDSFKRHNELSDNAIKMELEQIKPKKEINLLGFGLDEGHYEQHIAAYLLFSGKAEKVNLFGFDPYAKRNPAILYLSINELHSNQRTFDLIIARWVLHHVEMKSRWSTFVSCINRCNPGAQILVVEHGYLENTSFLNRKFSALLNATFDIVSNIGLRPGYFLNTKNMGEDFYIDYLEPKDFLTINSQVLVNLDMELYDVGPGFPNQTLCKMSIK